MSAVADPATGVWVYDSADGGFEVFGGTSVSSPIVASFYALAGNGASSAQLGSYPYAHPTSLNDIVSGSNGSCSGSYLCTGKRGYDGPTGLGTPSTAAAFSSGVVGPPPARDFSLTASPVAPVLPGANVKSTVTVAGQNGFTGTVKLTTTVTPSTGLTAGLSPSSLVITNAPRAATLTLTGHTGGNYTVTVTATSGALVHTTSFPMSVNDYSIALSPAKTSVVRGQQVQFTVTLGALGAFNSPVVLTVTGLPAKDIVTISQSPSPVPGLQTVTITTWAAYSPGSVTVHVNGASGNLKHTASATLVVQR